MVNEHHSYEFNKNYCIKTRLFVYSTHNPRATHIFDADVIYILNSL